MATAHPLSRMSDARPVAPATRAFLAVAALGAGLLHAALAPGAPPPLLAAFVALAAAELGWSVAALARDRLLPNIYDLVAFALLAALAVVTLHAAAAMHAPLSGLTTAPVTLDPALLPEYALRTTMRMFAAIIASLIFTFVVATLAAKSRRAELVIIPALDILQSVLATEIVCVLRYTMHAVTATGISSEGIKAEFAQHATEEQAHMMSVAERIDQLLQAVRKEDEAKGLRHDHDHEDTAGETGERDEDGADD